MGSSVRGKKPFSKLFDAAHISWKKTQASNLKHDPEQVAEKKEICGLLSTRRAEIESGELVVFMVDEYHLLAW